MSARAAKTFQVGITYCDGTAFVHNYEGVSAIKGSTKEYAELLAEAIQPSMNLPNARHIRLVTLIGFDAAHLPVHYIHSGLFECTHSNLGTGDTTSHEIPEA